MSPLEESGDRLVQTCPQTQALLLRLPAEVREMIYRYYLIFTWDIFSTTRRPQADLFDNPPNRPLPELMKTCKRLYQELVPRAFGCAALWVHHGDYIQWWGPDVLCGVAVYGPLRYSRLAKLVIIIHSPHSRTWRLTGVVYEILRRSTELREIVFELRTLPETVEQLETWIRDQKQNLVPALRQLEKLEILRLRGKVPNILVEALKETTGLTVISSELNEIEGSPEFQGIKSYKWDKYRKDHQQAMAARKKQTANGIIPVSLARLKYPKVSNF